MYEPGSSTNCSLEMSIETGVAPLEVQPNTIHAYHLYVIRLDFEVLGRDRAAIFAALRAEGIGVNVHYVPTHIHPFYQQQFGTRAGLCPAAEAAYEEILSLPMFPRMNDEDVHSVIAAFSKILSEPI